MNPDLDQWIAKFALMPGALGCGVQVPGRAALSRSCNEGFPQTHLNEALRCLGELLPLFSGHGLFPRWFTWDFELGQIRVVPRPDGAMLALVILPNSPAAENLKTLTGEFFTLNLEEA